MVSGPSFSKPFLFFFSWSLASGRVHVAWVRLTRTGRSDACNFRQPRCTCLALPGSRSILKPADKDNAVVGTEGEKKKKKKETKGVLEQKYISILFKLVYFELLLLQQFHLYPNEYPYMY